MTMKIFRRGTARIGLILALIAIIVFFYYISISQSSKDLHSKNKLTVSNHTNWSNWLNVNSNNDVHKAHKRKDISENIDDSLPDWNECSALKEANADINTKEVFSNFEFEPDWMKTKEYWDKDFESRYEKLMNNQQRPPLKIFITPHSHNDPGWLKTFVNYFQSDTRQILNLAVTKMPEFHNMTFIWSEISFLNLWWEQAHPSRQRALKKLVEEGRLEITTGGWVMTDEANVHLFAMLDQLIEGHQWVKTNLNYIPKSGWSIDPFGHGSTVPYLLASSGFEGTIIQRIHYSWKQWFAKNQASDFLWKPHWNTQKSKFNTMLTHNMPFDIYSIKHSCGPHPFICLNFDFRKIPGEYTEYSIKAQFINDENIQQKADLLMEQYTRTASLFPHNIALIPVGDDFRYNHEKEFNQQYENYKKLIDYINKNSATRYHNATIQFGTPIDYFRAIKERQNNKFPSLIGDFFVYADIFNEGRPAYWSGYFTTRPFYKLMSRDLEHNLRSLEILFTLAFNKARQHNLSNAFKVDEKNYEKIIQARRNLGLFQHHDAITGTSKVHVMRDYLNRLYESIQDTVKLQQQTIELLLQYPNENFQQNFIISELERDNSNRLPRKTASQILPDKNIDVVLFNSLTQERFEVVLLRVTKPNVKITDAQGNELPFQINPVFNVTEHPDTFARKVVVSKREYELMFIAKLPALSLSVFTLSYENDTNKFKMATIYCDECKDEGNEPTLFDIKQKEPGDIQVENFKMKLLFDGESGFLKSMTRHSMGRPIQMGIKFGAYKSAQFHSGAYLFRPESNDPRSAEKDVFETYRETKIMITTGSISSDVTVIHGAFLAHTVRIFKTQTYLDTAIFIENDIDFENPPKNRETEMFMRFNTAIENGVEEPEFYSDLNGFQWQPRKKVSQIGIEGNYYPITTSAFIQDKQMRLTLITTHAQGAASLEPGQIEVMLDRRTLYDDYRGMGEGIVDSRLTRHQFWITVEFFKAESDNEDKKYYNVPSLLAQHLTNSLNYPANIYFIEKYEESQQLNVQKSVQLLNYNLPCDLHLVNLRTLTEHNLPLFPSKSSLLIVQRFGYDCRLLNSSDDENDDSYGKICARNAGKFSSLKLFRDVKVEKIHRTSLTALKSYGLIKTFSSDPIEAMELRTFNVTFV
ncbi:hypothetical protein PVAND_003637 [Polypedilum vanderplanki]|uniref:Alpha-mannosidase n=1 Tax=Polypedilum vanderplanki TaxID=319348 RepID=A0A9J6BWH4_POLVA|nr:hypothetical protein PVAND_003637 [Polypedilum vanderplanki]